MSNYYPYHSCEECSKKNLQSSLEESDFFMGICDCCNEWKSVNYSSMPLNSQAFECTRNRNRLKICDQLQIALKYYMEHKQWEFASHICHRIDEIIHEILEYGIGENETIDVLSGKSRRKTRTRNKSPS